MNCKNCGNKLEEGERFCGKCGTKVEDNIQKDNKEEMHTTSESEITEPKTDKKITSKMVKKFKRFVKNNKIAILLCIIILVSIGIGGKTYLIDNKISDEYLTGKMLEIGFDKYDDVNISILDMEDINYNGFDKLILNTITVKNNGIDNTQVGFLLVNKKEDRVESFSFNTNIAYLLNRFI